MATRGGPARLVPGSPLAGVLRTAARNGRRATRSATGPAPAATDGKDGAAGATGARGPAGKDGEPGATGPRGPGAAAVAVLTTSAAGTVTWTFPTPLSGVPVVTATAVANVVTVCTILSVSATAVSLMVLRQNSGNDRFTPAVAVKLHAVAYLAS